MSSWCAEMSSEQIHDYAKFLLMLFFFSGGHVAKSRRSELLECNLVLECFGYLTLNWARFVGCTLWYRDRKRISLLKRGISVHLQPDDSVHKADFPVPDESTA